MAPLLIPLLTTVGVPAATAAATAANIATVAAVAGTTAGVVGGIQQARAIQAQAESAQNIAAYNAAVEKREAKAVRARARFGQTRQAKRAEEIKSALTARIGAAGGIGSPVAADLAAEQAAELELESMLIGFEGEIAAEQALSQAQIDKLRGKVAKERGRAEVTATAIRTGTTLLTGFA